MSQSKKEDGKKGEGDIPFDGVGAAAEMLEGLDPEHRARLLKDLAQKNPAIAAKIQKRTFTFQHLMRASLPDLQVLFTEIPRGKWVMARRKVEDDLRDHLYSGISKRTQEAIEEEMRDMGPQRVSDVLHAQDEIAQTAHRLLDEGRILLEGH